jgi:uncharacterized secreted protein with C-terminal beta-propeller domain
VRNSVLRRVGLSAAVVAVVAGVVIAVAVQRDDPATTVGPEPTTGVALVSFDSCPNVLDGFRDAAGSHVGAYGFAEQVGKGRTVEPGGAGMPDVAADAQVGAEAGGDAKAAAPQAPEHSGTNTHEAAVDEPDLVKTDGRRIVVVTGETLRVVDAATRQVTGSVDLDGGSASEMLLAGDRVLVIVAGAGYVPTGPTRSGSIGGEPARPKDVELSSRLVLVDIAGAPRIVASLAVDGDYVDARQVDGIARLVIRSVPRLGFVYPTDDRSPSQAIEENRGIVARSTVDDWLPRFRLDAGASTSAGRLVECDRVRHAASYSGTAMLTVLTVDLARELGTGDPITIAADGDTVYGTEDSLYVADDHVAHAAPARGLMPAPDSGSVGKTEIHRFDISGAQPPRYVGSGQVDGTLLNQYSLSEHQGHLRVATTTSGSRPRQGTSSESLITVLATGGDRLVQVGRLAGLGIGERIYAVRMLGSVGYVVTFRQVDPLYTIDLSDPRNPRKVGELKITGYSAYLHPAGDGRLIGVGQEATEQGRRLGTQVSLFDVSAPASPRRIAQYQVAGGTSEVEFDPHAFLYWPAKQLLVIPLTSQAGIAQRPTGSTGGTPIAPTGGALVLRLTEGSVTEIGRITHPVDAKYGGGAIRRALVIGDDLWTVSQSGVLVSDLERAAQRAWVPFS